MNETNITNELIIPGLVEPHLVTVHPHPLQVLVDILEPLRIPLLVLAAGLLVYGIWRRRNVKKICTGPF